MWKEKQFFYKKLIFFFLIFFFFFLEIRTTKKERNFENKNIKERRKKKNNSVIPFLGEKSDFVRRILLQRLSFTSINDFSEIRDHVLLLILARRQARRLIATRVRTNKQIFESFNILIATFKVVDVLEWSLENRRAWRHQYDRFLPMVFVCFYHFRDRWEVLIAHWPGFRAIWVGDWWVVELFCVMHPWNNPIPNCWKKNLLKKKNWKMKFFFFYPWLLLYLTKNSPGSANSRRVVAIIYFDLKKKSKKF